jgi:hypothetical protein
VLESVLVNINSTCLVGQTRVNKELVGFAWGVDASCVEVFFNYDS